MNYFWPMLCCLFCWVTASQAQANFHSAMPVAGDRQASFQWTIGEVFSGPQPDATGASLTAGFIQPMLTVATDLSPRMERAEVSAFPIPARDHLTVQFDQASDWTLHLLDVQGRTLSFWSVRGRQTVIPLGELLPGIYVLRVLDAHLRSQIIRFIKH